MIILKQDMGDIQSKSAFSRPSKSVFTSNSMVHCDETVHPIVLKFSMVLDIGLGILNPFLSFEYPINS